MRKTIPVAVIASLITWTAPDVTLAACTLPNALQNGDVADASKVMTDFNALANCADERAPAGSTNSIQYNAGSGSLGGAGPLEDGQTLIGSTGNPPQSGSLTAGAGISISSGPGSITISATGSGTGASVDWLNKAQVVKPNAGDFIIRTSTTPPEDVAISNTTRGILLAAASVADGRAMMAEASVPSGNWQATMLAIYTGPLSTYSLPGIAVRDSVLNRAVTFSVGGNGAGLRFDYNKSSGGVGLNGWTGDTQLFDTGLSTPSEPAWARLAYDGTNLNYSFSRDGQNFIQIFTVSATDYLTNLSGVGPAALFQQPTHTWNAGYHVLSWQVLSN